MKNIFVFILSITYTFSHVHIIREAKRILRPFGHVLGHIKTDFQKPFKRRFEHMHYVYAQTLYQSSISKGRIGRSELAVALPDPSALGKVVKIFYPRTHRVVKARVKEIGPWFTRNPYWLHKEDPRAETSRVNDIGEKITYPAGILLSPAVWRRLGVSPKFLKTKNVQDEIGWAFEKPLPQKKIRTHSRARTHTKYRFY
ncbi:MAG: hypothetical protein COB02_11390 [Candidatus Cloacimonadota bacterium]|nr:MAG: hypothetical protein COB02_11390 [Candidatus Cloacimonadota bacterium]